MDEQQQLANAYHSNKLSHAYLFEGDDAETMKRVAIHFTKLILCNNSNQCELKVDTFNHPDFSYVCLLMKIQLKNKLKTCSSYEPTLPMRVNIKYI